MNHFTGHDSSTVTLAIDGMTCGSCERHVRDTLAAVPGVATVEVSRARGLATVVGSTAPPDASALIDAVRAAGYDASVSRVGDGEPTPGARPAPAACGCCEA